MTLLHRPSIHLNKTFTTLKVPFHEIAQAYFLSPKFDNVLSTFFRRPPRSKITSLLEPTRIMTLLHRPSIHLNKSFTTLKVTFHEIAQAYFLSPKFDNVSSTFFVGHLDQKLPLCYNLLGLRHSYIDPQFIWTSPSQHWKSLFMKLHKHIFWARNLTTYWVLFS